MRYLSSVKVLPQRFYQRDPDSVAESLLGKKLIRKTDDGDLLVGLIVETEAYFGLNDPASRAYYGVKDYNQLMWREPGRAFIYNVHKYWMFNIVAHVEAGIGAVLIRAIEPLKGIEIMKKNRPVTDITELTSGPGKLTTALEIDKSLNGVPVTTTGGAVMIADNRTDSEVERSHRIGVKRDLEKKLRFYVKGSRFVSR